MDLHVLEGATRTLCGRDMIKALEINCGPHYPSVYGVQNKPRENVENRLAKILEENKALFEPGLGKCTTTQATLKFKVEPVPKFFRARPVPLALRPKVEEKIKELVSNGTLTQVDHSEWATPLVVVPKPGAKTLLHLWEEPANPWQRLHMDFCQTQGGEKWLVIVDAKSKWPEVVRMGLTTAEHTIEKLRMIFAYHGLPEQMVSDNGPPFSSTRFKKFCQERNIELTLTSPYHPNSNGEAERFVQTFKKGWYKGLRDGKKPGDILAGLLFEYRVTPHPATGKSPAEILMGRELRTTLDVHKTKRKTLGDTSYRKRMKADYDRRGRAERAFVVGQQVYMRNYQKGDKWIPGIITQVVGKRVYEVHFGTGSRKAHADQLKERIMSEEDYALMTGKRIPVQEQVLPLRRSSRTRKPTVRMRTYVEEREKPVRTRGSVKVVDVASHVDGKSIKTGKRVNASFMWTYVPTTPSYPAPPPPPPPTTPSAQMATLPSPPIVIQVTSPAQGQGVPAVAAQGGARGTNPPLRGVGAYRGRGVRRPRRERRVALRKELSE
ncbi:integrase core domain protein, partial [Ostertagia ostertagi]